MKEESQRTNGEPVRTLRTLYWCSRIGRLALIALSRSSWSCKEACGGRGADKGAYKGEGRRRASRALHRAGGCIVRINVLASVQTTCLCSACLAPLYQPNYCSRATWTRLRLRP